MEKFLNKIICGDCIKVLSKVEEPFADLIFADPPFNIGYKYDKYNDKVKKENYIKWTEDWMAACKKVLKPTGSFYIAIGDDYAANVKILADKIGLFMRNWIIWHYTFGQQMKNKFARSHTHIFYFVNNEKNFTFNDQQTRVLSDRQKIYRDKRANPDGKLPDDVWNEFPRVCGTFEERTGWHPCQMPESILGRIIRVSSNEQDWVLDPFSGSGTTPVVAAKLGRRYTGIELSAEYAKETRRRIANFKDKPVEGEGSKDWTEHSETNLKWLYHEMKITTEELADDNYLLTLFTDKFNTRLGEKLNPYSAKDVKKYLVRMRKAGKLGPLERSRPNRV